ncbi:phosphate ABC transporter permease PstA [Anaplasma capra]|uniref:phosphate ABC transporter permease PstA n=1 Tax=Anaplasma capra TaxID=1562740 RepID=UPI0021D60BA5|nr:phosphate ABC transporter permease PstA [Anaplasma capra]MCU7611539.1 phosphate ABC transporter permease PstA [Anaplasma capra]MCU7612022.1 phosphate ABC transporter permease PstA [Anaplasma capra]
MEKDPTKLLKHHRKSVRIFLRSKKDRLLSVISLGALGISVGMLIFVLCSIVNDGYKALTTTKILLSFDEIESVDPGDSRFRIVCMQHIQSALEKIIQNSVDLSDHTTKRIAHSVISETAHYDLARLIKKNAKLSGASLWFNASSDFTGSPRGSSEIYDAIMQRLIDEGRIRSFFNYSLFTNSHSKVPESAGIIGALIGSLLTITVCLAVAIPVGVMSGICMQELLKRGKLASMIEVSINNLSSVPSIIFGVLGLIVYLNIFGVPRSSALAGGLTLSIMILPNLIISTRQAFAAVPESVKQAAFALGASEMQVIMHHSFPIALPAVVQGVIVSVARIIGESSPLIMIGMVAFVVDLPKTFLDPASVLPVQIYIWANNSNVEFTKISAIAILALLIILLILNMIADLIKKRFDNFSF